LPRDRLGTLEAIVKRLLIPALGATFLLGLGALVALYFVLDTRISQEAKALRDSDTQINRDLGDLKTEVRVDSARREERERQGQPRRRN
jgi:hypothetical protein